MIEKVVRPFDGEDKRKIEKIWHIARLAVKTEIENLTDLPPELFRVKHERCDILRKATGGMKVINGGEEERRSPVFRLECELHSESSCRFYLDDGEEVTVLRC